MAAEKSVNEQFTSVTQKLAQAKVGSADLTISIKRLDVWTMAREENHNQLRQQVEDMFNRPDSGPLGSMEILLHGLQSELDMQNEPDPPMNMLVKDMTKCILQSMGLSVHVTSLSGKIIYWNPMAEQLFGYSIEQALGQKGLDLLCSTNMHELANRVGAIIRMGNSWSGQFPLRTRSGEEFTAVVSASPLTFVKDKVSGVITVSSRLKLVPFEQSHSSPELTLQRHSGPICMPQTVIEGQKHMQTLSVPNRRKSPQPQMINRNFAVTGVLCPSSWSSRRNNFLVDQAPLLQPVDFEIPWTQLQLGVRIGEGSCGRVYHGTWLGSDVAVKMFSQQEYSPELIQDFKKEVSIMKAVRHPNILLFMGAVIEPEQLSIITEFLPRGSLFRVLHRSTQKLSWSRRINMALDVALGMNYLHHQMPHIIHGDLKSSNLLVAEDWKVKVGDFGLSRLKNSSSLTRMPDKGTAQWMAPEVLRNESFTEKSDVYSFGVILWELATRKIPWDEMSLLEVIGAVGMLDRRLEIPENIDPQYAELISACFSTDPHLRPSFDLVVSTLKDIRKPSSHTHG